MSRSASVLIAVGLGVVALLSRLPFASHTLWAWDSVLYARALEQGFHVGASVAEQRPHPPGYVLYVALADLFRPALHDANGALVAVSVLASALAVVAVFLLTERFASRGPAVLAAMGFAFNPLVWLYGEVAYPYLLLGFLMVALAALFRAIRPRASRDRVIVSAVFGLCLGFRQDLLLLLGPLWLWLLWPASWRERAAHVIAFGAACLLWFVPSALLSGGAGEYLRVVLGQSRGVAASYSVAENGLEAFSYNLRFTLYALAWGLFWGGWAFLIGLGGAPLLWWLRTGHRRVRLHPDNVFFLLWLLPATVIYIVVHIGEWGYVLSILPGLYVLIGALVPPLVRSLHGVAKQAWGVVAATALVVLPALVFLYVPDARFSADAIADHDRALTSRVAYVRANFPPAATIVLAREDYQQVRYYLGDYNAWYYDPDPYAKSLKKRRMPASTTTTVVLFTRGLQPQQPQDLRYVEVAPDVQLGYFVVEPGAVIEFNGTRFGVREATVR